MNRFPYDDAFDPPAPVVPLKVTHPDNDRRETSIVIGALLDTGADSTCIPEAIARRLRLPTVAHAVVEGVGGSRSQVRVYGAWVQVGTIHVLARIVGLDNEAIVGRDVLAHGVVCLDGPRKEATLRAKRRKR